jgi:glutathione S-transferase
MSRIVTALHDGPEGAKGQVRDLRVRWALEEAGLTYQTRTFGFGEPRKGSDLADQPFGQVPAYAEGELRIFESGAILLHIAGQSEALLPRDPAQAARATSWLFAALNSVEPVTWQMVIMTKYVWGDRPWAADARAAALDFAQGRLRSVANWLGDRPWLEDRFTVGDLAMVSVLRSLPADYLAPHPELQAYVARGLARPAFQRALTAHLADFRHPEAA